MKEFGNLYNSNSNLHIDTSPRNRVSHIMTKPKLINNYCNKNDDEVALEGMEGVVAKNMNMV